MNLEQGAQEKKSCSAARSSTEYVKLGRMMRSFHVRRGSYVNAIPASGIYWTQ